MASRADFSDEEWEVLVRTPLLACWAVIAAAPTGPVGMVTELQAMLEAMSETRRRAPAGSLVGALSASLRHRINQSELRVNELPLEVVRQRAIEAAREASALLVARGAVDELPSYGTWIMDVARQVAAASKESGGLGADARVRPAESTLIDELRQALEPGTASG
jgi:hypothetical protein